MAIVYEKLLALDIPPVEHSYGWKDCVLYALGLGLGQDPMNADELAFVYEKNLKALPTFALVQGYSPYWLRNPDSGVNWTKVVHGEQGFTLHQPVKTQGTVIGRTRIVEVIDNGIGVPPEARARLFQRFFRAHERSMPDVDGTGLGLSIIRDTVGGLGGRAWAEFPDKGSVFAFSLPSRRETDVEALT